jgi:phosphotransacetylase
MEHREESAKESHEFKLTKPKVAYKSLSYAVWLASDTTLEVVQAAGGDL